MYVDHAATTPISAPALAALTRELSRSGNPSSLHGSGRRARRSVEEARETIAAAAGAHASEVVFTSGGTEADNLAVKGLFWARRAADPSRTRILCSAVEHHAVQDTVEWLERHEGAEVVWLPVDATGLVVTGGRRLGMTSARANCRALCGTTDAIAAPSRTCRCQSSGRVKVIVSVMEADSGTGLIVPRGLSARPHGFGRPPGPSEALTCPVSIR